jgi:hypothetical protein
LSDEFAPLRQPIADGLAALETATDYLIDADPAHAAAGAVPYLDLFGTALGGALLARLAVEAGRRGHPLAAAKLATARFFAEHELARAPGFLAAIKGGSTVVDFDPDEL